MTVTSATFTGFPGADNIQSASLVNVIPLMVCREGTGFEIVAGSSPGNREAGYSDGEGRITFADVFAGNIANDIRERIFVKYQY